MSNVTDSAWAVFFCNLPDLISIELKQSSFEGIKALIDGLESSAKSNALRLQEIDLSSNDLSSVTESEWRSFFDSCSILNELNLRYCQIGVVGIKALVKGLEHTKSIKKLNLELNNLLDDEEWMKTLASLLETNNTIKGLDLSYTVTTEEDAQVLADALRKNSVLERIEVVDLCSNGKEIFHQLEGFTFNDYELCRDTTLKEKKVEVTDFGNKIIN